MAVKNVAIFSLLDKDLMLSENDSFSLRRKDEVEAFYFLKFSHSDIFPVVVSA